MNKNRNKTGESKEANKKVKNNKRNINNTELKENCEQLAGLSNNFLNLFFGFDEQAIINTIFDKYFQNIDVEIRRTISSYLFTDSVALKKVYLSKSFFDKIFQRFFVSGKGV
jgi:hypothetical protein